jgi:hypothetical protein
MTGTSFRVAAFSLEAEMADEAAVLHMPNMIEQH